MFCGIQQKRSINLADAVLPPCTWMSTTRAVYLILMNWGEFVGGDGGDLCCTSFNLRRDNLREHFHALVS